MASLWFESVSHSDGFHSRTRSATAWHTWFSYCPCGRLRFLMALTRVFFWVSVLVISLPTKSLGFIAAVVHACRIKALPDTASRDASRRVWSASLSSKKISGSWKVSWLLGVTERNKISSIHEARIRRNLSSGDSRRLVRWFLSSATGLEFRVTSPSWACGLAGLFGDLFNTRDLIHWRVAGDDLGSENAPNCCWYMCLTKACPSLWIFGAQTWTM